MVYKHILCIRKLKYKHFTLAFRLKNNICEFTALEHKLKRGFCNLKPVSKVCFKDFWYIKK